MDKDLGVYGIWMDRRAELGAAPYWVIFVSFYFVSGTYITGCMINEAAAPSLKHSPGFHIN